MMFGLSTDQWMSLIRQILPVIGTIATTFGWATPADVATWSTMAMQVAGPLAIVGGSVWSVLVHRKSALLTTVAQMPEVEKIKLAPIQTARDLEAVTPPNVSTRL